MVLSLFGQSPTASTFAHPATTVGEAEAITSVAATPAERHACRRVPRLIGLSLSAARDRATRAGCKLQAREASTGQPIKREPYGPQAAQIVVRQTPRAGRAGRTVTIWLKPLCSQSADPGPPAGEPLVKRGPTELISGLYLDGGPHRFTPRCQPGTPSPGTITVTSATTGAVVASDSVASGKLATIPLAPGTYTIVGTFGDATSNSQPIGTPPQQVTITAGHTVRQDIVVSIP